MILTAHQPVYLPWLGLFHKIASADMFCYFDIAQYQTKDYNNRNKIKTNTGELWLSVPVESKNHFGKKVGEIRIVQDGWQRKHIKTIQLQYQRAPYYSNYKDRIFEVIEKDSKETLGDLNLQMLICLKNILGITTPIVIASEHDFQNSKSDLVLDMCLKLGAEKYIFGSQGGNYADVQKFRNSGVESYFQNYKHPIYKQLHGEFIPYMSVIDLIFNEGPNSLNIIMQENANPCLNV